MLLDPTLTSQNLSGFLNYGNEMTEKIDLTKYQEFVQAVTSAPSNDLEAFIDRVRELDAQGVNAVRKASLMS